MSKTRVLPVTKSIRAIPGLLDAVAQAIYETHAPRFRQRIGDVAGTRVPVWENASDAVRDWVTAQAVAATDIVDDYLAQYGKEWECREPMREKIVDSAQRSVDSEADEMDHVPR
jgi:hypothetical protein